MTATEDARAACDSSRWGDAWRLLSEVDLDALDVDDLDRRATAAFLTGHHARRLRRLDPRLPALPGRGVGPPGRLLRRPDRRGARLHGRPGPVSRLGRPRDRPPRAGRHRLRGAGLPRARARDDAALRGRGHRRRPRPLRAGGQDRRPVRPPRAGHARPHRRGPHAHLPRRPGRGDGAPRRGHGVDRDRRSLPAGDRRRLLHGDRRLLGALRPRALPQLDRLLHAVVRDPAGARALPGALLPPHGRGARPPRALARGARPGPSRLRAPGRTGPPDGAGGGIGDRRRPPAAHGRPRRRRSLLPARQRARPRPATGPRAPPGGARPPRRGRRRHPARPGRGG